MVEQGLQDTTLSMSFTISAATDVELTDPSTGVVKYYDEGGHLIEKANPTKIGAFQVSTPVWVEDSAYTAAVADGTLAGLVGTTWSVAVSNESGVRLLAHSGSPTWASSGATLVFDVGISGTGTTLTITEHDGGNMDVTAGVATAYFALLADTSHVEAIKDLGDYADLAASTAIHVGELVKHTDNKYYVCKTGYTKAAADTPFDATKYYPGSSTKPTIREHDVIKIGDINKVVA